MIKNKIVEALVVSSFSFFFLQTSQTFALLEVSSEDIHFSQIAAKRVSLVYDGDKREFTATLDGKSRKINNYDVSGIPQNISDEQLGAFLKVGYLLLGQVGDDLSLKAYGRLRGGGKIGEKLGNEGAGRVVGGVAGAAAGGAAGAYIGGAVGGPGGAALGAAVGAAIAYGGEALGSQQSSGTGTGTGRGAGRGGGKGW